MAVYVLVDCSGSMGGDRIAQASQAAAVITNALMEVNIPVACAGFSTKNKDVTHIQAKTYEQTQTYCLSMFADAENRDGFSIRLAASELLKRPEDQKILFVLSDGLPSHCHYDFYYGRPGAIDTAEAVREAQRQGITVIGLFFGAAVNFRTYQFMFPEAVFAIHAANLEPILARTIKTLLEKE